MYSVEQCERGSNRGEETVGGRDNGGVKSSQKCNLIRFL